MLSAVDLRFDLHAVLHQIDWQVEPGQRWVVIGPNGSGKTSLLRLVGAWLRPTAGTADVLGERIGRTDVRVLRRSIGYTSQALTDQLRPGLTPLQIVAAGRHAALEVWWHTYGDDDWTDAADRLARFGVEGETSRRPLHTLSAGERQRVLLARAFAHDPGLIVLDEPTAGLDVGGREDLLRRLDAEAEAHPAPIILVTHHLEEVPPSWTHALLLQAGRVVGSGPIDEVVTSASLSALYGLRLEVTRTRNRWSALAP